LPEFIDGTVTDYSRTSLTIVSTSAESQNKDASTSEDVASPNPPKPFVKHSNKRPKGNQRNWNNLKSYQLGTEFVLHKKPCFNCGDFSHLANDCRRRVQRETTRPAGHRPHGPSMNVRRPNMNGARPYKSFFNQAPSYETRPFLKSSAVRTQYRAPWVPTVNRNNPPVSRKFSTSSRNFLTVTRKFPTASRKFINGSTKNHTADMGRREKAVKPLACWTWNPLQKLSNKGSSQNNIDDKGYWDSGCSRHMTGNISYLSDFETFDGGYVSFGQGGCRITGKGTVKTGKLEFKNVYFVKDLKYNL
nr:ribonuclease H-like domain-containing protein [Tanacetum cinerariifolium]